MSKSWRAPALVIVLVVASLGGGFWAGFSYSRSSLLSYQDQIEQLLTEIDGLKGQIDSLQNTNTNSNPISMVYMDAVIINHGTTVYGPVLDVSNYSKVQIIFPNVTGFDPNYIDWRVYFTTDVMTASGFSFDANQARETSILGDEMYITVYNHAGSQNSANMAIRLVP